MPPEIPDTIADKKIKAPSEKAPVLKRVRGKWFFFGLMVWVTVFHPGSVGSDTQGLISLELRDEPLGKTLDQVSKISGYTIYLQPKWRDIKVSVTLINLSLEQAILKILDKRINHAIIWNDKKKKISITGAEIFRPVRAIK